MNKMKNCLVALVALIAVSGAYAAGNFTCPAPSAIKAVPATHPFPPSPGFNYVATDSAGVQFKSIYAVIGDSAPTISSFNSATWTNITNSGGYNGSAACFYMDSTGRMQSLNDVNASGSIMYQGSNWSNQNTPFYECNSSNLQDCNFTFSE